MSRNPAPEAAGPLSIPVFRMMWTAWLMANICMWMNEVSAAWLMTSLTPSPAMVALVQTASTLPMFLLGLPSGALADIVDRRLYFMATQIWVAAVAVVMCAVVIGDAMNPGLLLTLTFANGIGMAMRWPTFAAIVPELVPRTQLSSALALNGVSMNMSRIVGPIVAGALIAGAGIAWVFVLNALLSLAAAVAIWHWKRVPTPSALPGERFIGAIRVGVQYVRQSQRMRRVLVRILLFFVQSTALLALLPLEAKRLQALTGGGAGAGTYTLLLASMGLGAIIAGLFLPRMREQISRDVLVTWGSVVQAAATAVVAAAPNRWIAVPGMIVAGMAWISVANSLTVSAQLALPDWVRARGMAIYQMALMGGAGLGAALWGQVATWSSVPVALTAAAVFGTVAALVTRHLMIHTGPDEDLTPIHPWTPPEAPNPLPPESGPVLVTIEYWVDAARSDEFREVMQESRSARLRHGALSWELFEDIAQPGRFLEYYIDESWVEHLRRFDRASAADVALRERRLAFHTGPEAPRVTRYLSSSR